MPARELAENRSMGFKFEKLEVWQSSLEYFDLMHEIADGLPSTERFNLQSQIVRAATSISLNIAEGSTSQSDAEQDRFLGYAIRSLIETVACLHLVHRRKSLSDATMLRRSCQAACALLIRLQAMRRSLTPRGEAVREDAVAYEAAFVEAPGPDDATPFDDSPSSVPGLRSSGSGNP